MAGSYFNFDSINLTSSFFVTSPPSQNSERVTEGFMVVIYAQSIQKFSGIYPSRYQSILVIRISVIQSSFLSIFCVYLHTQCYKNSSILLYPSFFQASLRNEEQSPPFDCRNNFYLINRPTSFYLSSAALSVSKTLIYLALSRISCMIELFSSSFSATKLTIFSYLSN